MNHNLNGWAPAGDAGMSRARRDPGDPATARQSRERRRLRRLRLRRHGRRAYIRSVYSLPSLATLGECHLRFCLDVDRRAGAGRPRPRAIRGPRSSIAISLRPRHT